MKRKYKHNNNNNNKIENLNDFLDEDSLIFCSLSDKELAIYTEVMLEALDETNSK